MYEMEDIERYKYNQYREQYERRNNLTAQVWLAALAVLGVFAILVLAL